MSGLFMLQVICAAINLIAVGVGMFCYLQGQWKATWLVAWASFWTIWCVVWAAAEWGRMLQ